MSLTGHGRGTFLDCAWRRARGGFRYLICTSKTGGTFISSICSTRTSRLIYATRNGTRCAAWWKRSSEPHGGIHEAQAGKEKFVTVRWSVAVSIRSIGLRARRKSLGAGKRIAAAPKTADRKTDSRHPAIVPCEPGRLRPPHQREPQRGRELGARRPPPARSHAEGPDDCL